MAAASNVIHFGILHDQGYKQVTLYLVYVEETLVPIPGSLAGSFSSSCNAHILHRLGSDHELVLSSGSVGRGHHLSWHIN